jgi:LDH2 family malate/lactate/ureidoglycolate dehydrogenase
MDRAIAKAKATGSGLAIVRRAGDSGALVSFTLRALKHDCIGVMFNNTNPYFAPWGGAERILGLPPVSIAVPAGEVFPVVLDTALTDVQQYFDRPELWAKPYDKPPLLTFATRREYALTVMIELLSGGLALMPLGRDKTRRGEVAVFVLAIHIPHFANSADFRTGVDRYVRQMKNVERAAGVEEIMLPGERGFREAERRRRDGIPVTEEVWSDTIEVCEEIGVNAKEFISKAS